MGLHMLLSWPRPAKALAAAAVLAIGVAAAVLPWTCRNYAVTGGFILISSNGGGNLYSANNPDAKGQYTETAWVYLFNHADDDLTLHRLGMRLALDWIRSHPRQFARLAATKFALFWHTDKDMPWWALAQPSTENKDLGIDPRWQLAAQAAATGFYAACFLSAIVGCWRRRRHMLRDRAWMIFPVLAGYFTAVHMVFESQAKYHYMLMPLLCILAALPAGLKPLSPLPLPRPAARRPGPNESASSGPATSPRRSGCPRCE
jgi:hypothetical protein